LEPNSETAPKHGVRLIVAYDGTDFCGFQEQPSQRTVQGALQDGIARMCGHPVQVRGAGRTDAGVHALGQVVAFDSARCIPPRGWQLGLNRHLPDDVRVQQASPCAVGYSPRFDSVGKTYRYLVQLGEAQNPLLRHRVWALAKHAHLDLPSIRAACAQLVGTHDFRAFRAADDTRQNTIRTLWRIDVLPGFAGDPSLLAFEVEGTAFMKNMVRILVGTLVDVGRGRIAPAHVPALLSPQAERPHAGMTAPAAGLTLVRVALGRLRAQGHAC
jgi:tRNA pseudouridine38-40 synthase